MGECDCEIEPIPDQPFSAKCVNMNCKCKGKYCDCFIII